MIDEKILIKILEEVNQGVCHYCGCDLNSDDVRDIINELAEKPNQPHKTIYEQMKERQAENYAWQNRE